ncbi:hypothetical protein [Candidatus Enterococcus clewellii]|uniref:Uncharacterized protein n=1 Tax=Candidatus Enterococcus clewellii TaxID=1834193 RepID=A0A242KCP6_9ENTE|nr:hypothetical protein [Enterococcus sp. 9E7_DIV0242]OTP18320.1 hypothetical protein A5888_000134 [Enterococcus sp. 9E7_DIV0242]
MKWLALLNNSKTRTLYFSGVIFSLFYSFVSIYFYLTQGDRNVSGRLNTLILLLSISFIFCDTSRFSAFFLSKRVRLLPLKTGVLYLVNLLLSVVSGLVFILVNWGIASVAHLIMFQRLDVPQFDIPYLKSISFWFVLLSFYILLQFFVLLAQVVWQRWLPQLSKNWLVVIFLMLLIGFLFSQQLIPDSVMKGNFLIYLVILVVIAIGTSWQLIDKYLETEVG